MKSISTGVEGLDAIISGGLVQGSSTIIKGGAGTGKTIFGLSLVSGLSQHGVSSIFATFDESIPSIKSQMTSLSLADDHVSFIDMSFDPNTMITSDNFELSGIIMRIQLEIERTGAEVVVFDGFDVLIDSIGDSEKIRSEIHRVFSWTADKGLTLLATYGESGQVSEGFAPEDYASDCIIHLTQEMEQRQMTRVLRVIKCRKKAHGVNGFPYLINEEGIYLLPVTTSKLDYQAHTQRTASGIEGLDALLGGGIYEGSTLMVSGKSGTGKSLLALSFAHHCIKRGKKVLYFSFEESPSEIYRNTSALGLELVSDLSDSNKLNVESIRPVEMGLEQHLLRVMKVIEQVSPDLVVIDPITSLTDVSEQSDLKSMLMRMVTFLKQKSITSIFIELVKEKLDDNMAISSLTDSWIFLDLVDVNGEEKKSIRVKKSRGTSIDTHIHELLISNSGVKVRHSAFN